MCMTWHMHHGMHSMALHQLDLAATGRRCRRQNPTPNPNPNQALQAAQGHLASPHALGAGSVFSWGRGEFGALGHRSVVEAP